jgi:hypothetical protein
MDKEAREIDPFEQGQTTERIPAWELGEDGIDPENSEIASRAYDRERAA